MHRIFQIAFWSIAIVLLFLAQRAFAWSEGGHKIIGSVAFQLLSPADQEKIVAILKHHPRFEEDFKSKMPDELKTPAEQNEWLFQQAAIWPDLVRVFTGDDLKTYHRQLWHYIALPNYLTDADRQALESTVTLNTSLVAPAGEPESMNIVQALQVARRMLADKTTPPEKQAVMLCWILHLVGDIHQPLHSTTLYSQAMFPKGDYVGNKIVTEPVKNLHATWDQAMGTKTTFKVAHDKARELITPHQTNRGNPARNERFAKAAANLDVKQWLQESREIALKGGYNAEVTTYVRAETGIAEPPPLHLSDEYIQNAHEISQQRATLAGYRLAAVLKQIVE
jgi:hypothetical protein